MLKVLILFVLVGISEAFSSGVMRFSMEHSKVHCKYQTCNVPCKAAISKASRNGHFNFSRMTQGEFPPQHQKFLFYLYPNFQAKMNADVIVCFQRYRVDRHTSVVNMQAEAIFGTTLVSNGIMAVSFLYTIYVNREMQKTVQQLSDKVDKLDKTTIKKIW
jgi:hypothetical protein